MDNDLESLLLSYVSFKIKSYLKILSSTFYYDYQHLFYLDYMLTNLIANFLF
jgi:hypothetical protein